MRKILLSATSVFVLVMAASPGRADDQADPQAVVDKAIKALGAEAKLAKLTAATWKIKGTVHSGQEIPFSAQWTMQGPDQFRTDGEVEIDATKFKIFIVINKDKGWFKFGEDTEELDKDRLPEEKMEPYINWLTTLAPLKNKEFKLSSTGESKVGDRAVVGITVSAKDRRDVNLFFDKENGLLLKSEARVKDRESGDEMNQEIFYNDYKKMEGVQRPSKITYKRNGKLFLEMEISEFKLLGKVEDSLFEKP